MPVVTAVNGQAAYFYGGVFDVEGKPLDPLHEVYF